jgi:Effector protein
MSSAPLSSFGSAESFSASDLWRSRELLGAFSRDIDTTTCEKAQRQQSSASLTSFFSTATPPASFRHGMPSARDTSTTPHLQTGFKASASADRMAREAWQPLAQDRAPAQGGKPGYTDLTQALDRARTEGRPVVATYGELIFLGDKGVDAGVQQRDVANALAALEKSPTGRRLLRDLAGNKGLPVVIELNNKTENEALRAESSGLGRPDGKGGLNPLNGRNFDIVKWDPTTAFTSKKGSSPPWVVLAHELRHAQQFEEMRAKNKSRANPDGRIVNETRLTADQNKNGIRDIEENAVSIERRIMLQLGLTPPRRVYSDPVTAVEVSGSTSIPNRMLAV